MQGIRVAVVLLSLVHFSKGDFAKIPTISDVSRVTRDLEELWLGLDATACNDSTSYDKSEVTYPPHYDYISMHKDIKFWKSDAVKAGVEAIRKFAIPGKPGLTVGDVLNYYTHPGMVDCWAYLWGGSIRDQYTQSPVNDADIEFSCNASIIYDACIDKWTDNFCRLTSHNTTIIGQYPNPKDIDAVDWSRGMLAEMVELEYTANSLGYDLNGNEVVVDISGMAKSDVCDRKIRIPAEHQHWQEWATPAKIFRYWKLRSKGFHAADNETESFIVETAQNYPTETLEKNACHIYFDGTYSNSSGRCTVSDCATAYSMFAKFKPFLEADLGSYWKTAKSAMETMMYACSTTAQPANEPTTAAPIATTSAASQPNVAEISTLLIIATITFVLFHLLAA